MNTDTVNEDGRNLPAVADAPALPQRDFRAGTAALAEMPEREFQERLTSMQRGRDRLKAIHFDLMTAKTDYDVIPGTAKPSLLKSGAEKLLHFYRLACEFVPGISYGDGEALPWISVVTECRLHVGDLEGPVVNTGHGAANSWEKRYRRGGGDVAAAHDMLNTLIKMSAKRAMVDATLRATATSGIYSQDMEDLAAPPESPQAAQDGKPGARPAKSGRERDKPVKGPESPPVICSQDGCGLILSTDEIKAAEKYHEEFYGDKFCSIHGREMLAIWRAKDATPAAEEEDEDPFSNE